MLDYRKIDQLANNKEFKQSNNLFKNLKHSTKLIMNNELDLSINVSDSGLGLEANILKFIFFICKPVFLAVEIRRFKQEIIKRAFIIYPELGSERIDFDSIIAKDYYWIEKEPEKLKFLKNIIVQYLTDPQVMKIILENSSDYISNEDMIQKYNDVIKLVKREFKNEISKSYRCSRIHLGNEYYEFVLDDEEYGEIYLENAFHGNLTDEKER